jgi:hypothetical protein
MQMINVMDYGAKGDGSTNDTVAINAALAAAGAMGVSGRGVDVYFPAGVYAHAGAIINNNNNVMMRGAGWQSTVLLYTGSTGDQVQIGSGGTNKSGSGLMNMSVWASGAKTTGASININGMNDCLIQNFVVNNYFQGILIQGASIKVWIDQGEINAGHVADGVGIQVTNGLAGDTYLKDIVMSNTPASKPAVGIQVTQAGHISILRCNVTSCIKGLHVNPQASQDVSYMFLDHCLFDSCGTHGAHFNPAGAATARVRSCICVNSWFSGTTTTGATSSGIEFTVTSSAIVDGISFIGCRILNNQRHGILINAGPTNISFTDCTVAGNSAETTTTYDGISMAANVSGIEVLGCKLGQAGTASNTQRYAVNIAAGTSANIMILNCDCQPNNTVGTHGYINIGALTGGGISIHGNNPGIDKWFGSARITASAAINTTHTIISSILAAENRLMANALRAGTTIEFEIIGTCTASVANASTFRVLMGTNNSTADTAVLTAAVTSAATGTAVPFRIRITLTCRTVGASASFYGAMTVWNNGVTGISSTADANLTVLGTMLTVSSLNALYVNLSYQSAASTTTSTFQIVAMSVRTV